MLNKKLSVCLTLNNVDVQLLDPFMIWNIQFWGGFKTKSTLQVYSQNLYLWP